MHPNLQPSQWIFPSQTKHWKAQHAINADPRQPYGGVSHSSLSAWHADTSGVDMKIVGNFCEPPLVTPCFFVFPPPIPIAKPGNPPNSCATSLLHPPPQQIMAFSRTRFGCLLLVLVSIGALQVWARSEHVEKGDGLVTFSLEELDEHLQVRNLPA